MVVFIAHVRHMPLFRFVVYTVIYRGIGRRIPGAIVETEFPHFERSTPAMYAKGSLGPARDSDQS